MTTPAKIFGVLSSAECEAIAERFVAAMCEGAKKRCTSEQLARSLYEIWSDILEWTGLEVEPAPVAERVREPVKTRRPPRSHIYCGKATTITELAAMAGCSAETMRKRLERLSPEIAVAKGGPAQNTGPVDTPWRRQQIGRGGL